MIMGQEYSFRVENEPPQETNRPAAGSGTKKIPPHLRGTPIRFSTERSPFKRLLWRLREDSQFLRQTIQLAFALLCVWIGIEFYLFVRWGMSGGTEQFFSRPPGAEG